MGDAHDPEIYISHAVRVFQQYPMDVMREVAAKLPEQLKWLPTIAEIKSACEERHSPMRYAMQWEQAARRQIQERKTMAITDGRPRNTYEEIKAEFAAIGIYLGLEKSKLDVTAIRQKHGISQEQWDAIPNANHRR